MNGKEGGGLEGFMDNITTLYSTNRRIGSLTTSSGEKPLYLKTHTAAAPYVERNKKDQRPLKHNGTSIKLFANFYTLKDSFTGNPYSRDWPSAYESAEESDEIRIDNYSGYGEFCTPDNVLFMWNIGLERQTHALVPVERGVSVMWRGFERLLTETFPNAGKIYTANFSGGYERASYQEFLRSQGYSPYNDELGVEYLWEKPLK